MSSELPPIVQIAQQLQGEIDNAVRRFRKDERYDTGARIRERVTHVRRIAFRAWNSKERRPALLQELVDTVEDLKLELQLGKDVKAFPSFPEFEQIWRTWAELKEQARKWHKSVHPKSQNPAPADAAAGVSKETEYPRCPRQRAQG